MGRSASERLSNVPRLAGDPSRFPHLLVLSLVFLGAACRTHVGFREQYVRTLRPAISAGDWSGAAEALQRSKGSVYREEDRVMFWLNQGAALHYAGRYSESSKVLFQAEETIQDLFTKSVSEQIGRFVANETVQTYAGEDHERILSYLYTALNAAAENRLQDALVEVRRADGFLRRLTVKAQQKDETRTPYTRDAFMLWFVGLFLEMEGSIQDAYLAYRDAWQAYVEVYEPNFRTPPPAFLGEDLVRLARVLGREEEAEDWAQMARARDFTHRRLEAGDAEIILVHGLGEAPFKREKTFNAVLPDGYTVRVAIPEVVPSPRRSGGSMLIVDGRGTPSVVAEPVSAIAVSSFRAREGEIRARAVARAAIKYGATKATSELVASAVEEREEEENEDRGERRRGRSNQRSDGAELAGALVNVLGGLLAAASEGADLRAWTLLPAEFRVARMWVRPGRHELQIELLDARGQAMGQLPPISVELAAGEKRLFSVRSLGGR